MAEYIDKDKVHKRLTILEMKLIEEEGYYDRFTKGFGECMWHIANFPAETDVVEVVRCKDCKHRYEDAEWRMRCRKMRFFECDDDNWFCPNGERKADNA